MTIKLRTRLLALLLAALFLLPSFASSAADASDSFFCEKSAVMQDDGACRITLQAFQTGYVAPTDIVLVLDVSGSMENSTPVPSDQIDPAKDYYIRYRHEIIYEGQTAIQEDNIRVHNEAAEGETPRWFGVLEEGRQPTQVYPVGSGQETEYTFYTGAMEALRKAATDFTGSIAANARENGAAHRIAVVEFSSPVAKGAAKCTHDNPFYANILSGDGTSTGALVSADGAQAQLDDIFANLTAAGPTYSDDALAQAEAILSAAGGHHKVVVLFTDGGPGSFGWSSPEWQYDRDNSALPTANAAIAAAKRMKDSGVLVYTIGVFNEENLQGEVGEKNQTYLHYISSDYPKATDMNTSGARAATQYCSIGDLQMDLSGAFAEISAVIGEPIRSAQVLDTVSEYFYLTDTQKQALTAACPGVQITENADGTTTIRLDDIDFPPVPVTPDGTPVSEDDAGIFSLSFDVTPRENLLGGKAIVTNTGDCGVFAGGVRLSAFEAPQVDVPVSTDKLSSLFTVKDVTIYKGQQLSAADLYEDLSAQMLLPGAAVTFRVADANGEAFTSGAPTESGTFTVTADVKIGDDTYSFSRDVSVQVDPDAPRSLRITSLPTKRTYFAGDTLDPAGLAAEVQYLSGKTEPLTAADWTLSPTALNSVGTQTVTLTSQGLTATFTVTVQAVRAVRMEIVSKPESTSYVYRRSPDFSGLRAEVFYNNGTSVTLSYPDGLTVGIVSGEGMRRGDQTFRASALGVSADFTMQVRLVWWQWLILIFLLGWLWY